MWEYRLVWAAKPPWWDEAWKRGLDVVSRQGRKVEQRPDAYLVLSHRLDVGLKLRGEDEKDFDAKVLHERRGGWELWEKVIYFRWDALEATRLASMLRIRPVSQSCPANTTPSQGAQQLLAASGIEVLKVKVEKTRIQAAAADLLAGVGAPVPPDWIAELAEIRLPRSEGPSFSLCLETLDPLRGSLEAFPTSGALCLGYPELLLKHERGGL